MKYLPPIIEVHEEGSVIFIRTEEGIFTDHIFVLFIFVVSLCPFSRTNILLAGEIGIVPLSDVAVEGLHVVHELIGAI